MLGGLSTVLEHPRAPKLVEEASQAVCAATYMSTCPCPCTCYMCMYMHMYM